MQVNLSKLVSYCNCYELPLLTLLVSSLRGLRCNCYELPLLTLLVSSLRGLRWHSLLLEVTLEDNNFRNGNAAVIGQLMEQVIGDRSL